MTYGIGIYLYFFSLIDMFEDISMSSEIEIYLFLFYFIVFFHSFFYLYVFVKFNFSLTPDYQLQLKANKHVFITSYIIFMHVYQCW